MLINSVIARVSTHMLYLIRCLHGLCYVSKTTRKLKQRISEHKSATRHNGRDCLVAVHYYDAGHDILTRKFHSIEKVSLPPCGGDLDQCFGCIINTEATEGS